MDRLKVRRASRRAQNTRLVNERPSELASFAQLRYDSDLQLHARPLRLPSPVDDPIGGSRLSKRRDPKKTLRNHKSGTRRLCHLKINDSSHCTGAVGASNPFCADNIDSRGYLSLLALENGDNFCLSYAWSNRDFSGGVLGLAYMSYPPASQGPFCGNKIREGTEECDCGFMEYQCRDSCCFANENKHNAQGCTLRPGTQCSPSAGSCCTADCRFINTNHQCAPEDECNLRSFCNGVSAQCPEQTKRPDLTVCNQNTQVCIRGHCVGSICLKYGFLNCQLSGGNYRQEDMCRIHCRTNDTGSSCLDPCTIAALKPLCKKVMERGAACNNNLGYCDVYHRCRPVEEEGTLSKLEALLDTGSWLRWVRDNFWLAATFTICIIAAVLLVARYCAFFVPSSNPALPRAKSVIQRFRSPSQTPAHR